MNSMINKQHKKQVLMPFKKQLGDYTAEKQRKRQRQRESKRLSVQGSEKAQR